ncbi:MAG: DUF2254 family protein [Lautropia sp.]|nr:DUF2254 family protein [Lautropia sp.]
MASSGRLLRTWKSWQQQLWFKPAWWGVLATVVALMAAVANHFVDENVLPKIARETLVGLLTIIASSMLAVTTFSLSILVQAFSSAAGSASPRALRVVMADDNAQTAIAAFIAAFIYSVIALMALGLEYYGPVGRFVLLIFTVVVMVNIIVMLIRWIRTLSRLGRMGYTIERVELAATAAMQEHWRAPLLGGQPLPANADTSGIEVTAATSGHVQHIDMAMLQQLAEAQGIDVHLQVRPGSFVSAGQLLARLHAHPDRDQKEDAACEAELLAACRKEIEVGVERNFEQDPRFGLVVLSEIGQRALSPAVNDGGTAINVAGAMARVLVDTRLAVEAEQRAAAEKRAADKQTQAGRANADDAPRFPQVYVPELDEADFIRDSFVPMQRDAGGLFEVQLRFVKVLDGIAQTHRGALREAARKAAWGGWLQAQDKLVLAEQREQLEDAARRTSGGFHASAISAGNASTGKSPTQ